MAKYSPNETVTTIKATLTRDPRLHLEQATLQISMDNGVLTLEGEVSDIAEKRLVTNLSAILAGEAITVVDNLCVATDQVPDDELGQHVGRQLVAESAFGKYPIVLHRNGEREYLQQPSGRQGRIDVAASDGIVTLRGTVGSLSHQRLAEVLCWWIPGCRRVDNRLTVVPGQTDSDNELSDAVRIALEKDPLVDAGQVRLGSAAGIIELDGLLPSDEARGLALRDTWAVPGVWDVVNRIETGGAPG